MRAALSLSFLIAVTGAASAQSDSGSYLAARQAFSDGNHAEAATYFERALADDGENVELISNAVLARAAMGDWDRAVFVAAGIPPGSPGRELANIIEQVDRMASGDRAGAIEAITQGQAAGPLVDDLSLAWMMLGAGEMSAASELLTELSAAGPLADIARYHLALIRAAVGDFEGADAILSGDEFGPLPANARALRAHAQVLVQLDRAEDAMQLLEDATAVVPDPTLMALSDAIAADPARPYDFVVTPEDGAAEAFYSVAQGLGTDSGVLALLYARAARVLREDHTDAILLAAQMLEETGQLEMAAATYETVTPEDPQYIQAGIGRANALLDLDRGDDAIAVLEQLSVDFDELSPVHAALGDAYRRQENYVDAITAYTTALGLVDQEQPRYWSLFYTRAIAYEREGLWDNAEADFRTALDLNPGQPQVLNYLGYSLVEQRRNFDEALDMIERAVAARPDSGYIVDSLGWVLYRLGRFEEAVEPMERAVELVPTDPVINDHLGDVYWMVGRIREAEFQWQRALSFEPEEADAERIRLKLQIGLDAVIEQEGGVGLVEE